MSSSDQKHVAVAGATGKLGKQIASSLLSISPDVQVHVLCRDKSKVDPELSSSSRVQVFESDGNSLDEARAAVRGCMSVVCAYLGPDDFMVNAQKILIDACEAEGVPRYIPSDYTLDYRPLNEGDLPNKDPMLKVTEYLKTKAKVKGVHVFIGCFVETFWFWLGAWEPEKTENGTFNIWGTGDEKWDFTTYGTAAKYTAHVALDESVVGYVKFRDTVISMNQIIDIFAAHGKRPNVNNQGTLGELKIRTDAERKKGQVTWPEMAMFYIYWIENGTTSLGPDSELSNGKYPDVKTVSMEEFMVQNVLRK